MATILVDGKQTEIDLRRLTLLCHRADVHLMPDGQVEIGPEQTLARADQITKDEWALLQKDPVYIELAEMVLGSGIFPMVGDLKQCGTGTRHITGLILMMLELEPGQTPYIRYPESFLHPLSQTRLADLFIRLTGAA